MIDLMIEILGYLAAAALIGFLLGWLVWGWGQRDRIASARADGARGARTSVDGDTGAKAKLLASAAERAVLEAEIDRLTERLAAAELATGLGAADDRAEADGEAHAPDADEPAAAGAADDDAAAPLTAGGAASGSPAKDEAAKLREHTAPAGRISVAGPTEPPVPIPLPDPQSDPQTDPQTDPQPEPETTRAAPAAPRAPDGGSMQGSGPDRLAGRAQRAEAASDQPGVAGRNASDGESVPADDAAAGRQNGPAAPAAALRAPDVTLRQRIMAEPGDRKSPAGADAVSDADSDAKSEAASDTPSDAAADMPHPPAFTLRRQRAAAAGDPTGSGDRRERPTRVGAPDGPAEPSSRPTPPAEAAPGGKTAGADAGGRPSIFALRRQRVSRPGEAGQDAAVARPGSPADATDSGAAGAMPRPADSTLRHQRSGGADEPPVADEQVPPAAGGADAAMPGSAMPNPAASTLRQQSEPTGDDQQVPPGPAEAGDAAGKDAAETDAAAGAAAPPVQPTPPASLLKQRPAAPDDLRRIRGIGKVTERLLNENGIWLYRQIAELGRGERAWLARLVGTPESRLDRDDWCGQARTLDRETRGGTADGEADSGTARGGSPSDGPAGGRQSSAGGGSQTDGDG